MGREEEEYYSYTREFFRRWARVYGFVDWLLRRTRRRVVKIADAPTGSRILDVATGTGHQAFAFAQKGYDVVGIDLSEDMLAAARKHNRFENLELIIGDATKMPFEDSSFDVVSISLALHDMPLAIRKSVLKEIGRVAKPSGKVVVIDYSSPKAGFWQTLTYKLTKTYESQYYPSFIQSDITDLLGAANIKVEAQYPSMRDVMQITVGVNRK